MRSRKPSVGITLIWAIFAITMLTTTTRTAAQTEGVLHNFNNNGTDGYQPLANINFGKSGNIYGTTELGGLYGAGTVFEASPKTGGGWTGKIVYNFNPGAGDGSEPVGGLLSDAHGNLYGTTYFGGAYGGGTVFELTPTSGGWSERILSSFQTADGTYPYGSLVLDDAGNLYGTTYSGGDFLAGTAYELVRGTGGLWEKKVLHSFGAAGDGADPQAGLIIDGSGNLYGTTFYGGANFCPNQNAPCGTVFEISPGAGGTWTETVLHNFSDNGTDGFLPPSPLTFDALGNLYGTTFLGGTSGLGVVFELSPVGGGSWTETIVVSFSGGNGIFPGWGGLVHDAAGNFYGTTQEGGVGYGNVFKLMPVAGGGWTETSYFNFSSSNGAYPVGGPAVDGRGNIFGTTQMGGSQGVGTVFEIKH